MKRKGKAVEVFGIGNPLIDILIQVEDRELDLFTLDKGKSVLIDDETANTLLNNLRSKNCIYSCGGSAPNTMVTLASLGIRTALAGMVGSDDLADIYKKRLEERNVISRLETCQGDTGSCIVLITPDSERTMNTRLGVCREYNHTHYNHDLIAGASFLYFTGFMWDTEVQKEAVLTAIKLAKQNGTTIVFDLADPFVVERNTEEFLGLIKNSIDIVLANREETKILLGYDDPEKASFQLAANCTLAVVKNSAEGSYIAKKDEMAMPVRAINVEALDSTGAGDNYAAGLIYGLLKGYSYLEAASIASYVAGQVVSMIGPQFDLTRSLQLKKDIESGVWQ